MAVAIYDNDTYRGLSAVAGYGEYWRVDQTLGFKGDVLTSLKIQPFTRVILYEHENYGGKALVIDGPKEIPKLTNYVGGMNDKTTSMRVQRLEPSAQFKAECCSGKRSVYECGEYASGGAICTNAMAGFCGVPSNISNDMCKTWCRNNTAYCDASVRSYCASNPNDSYCTCVLSKAGDPKYGVNPLCVDKKCMDTGYATTNMKNTQCPNVINCTVKNQLINSGVVISNNIQTDQNCGNEASTTQDEIVTDTSFTGKAKKWWSEQTQMIQYLILFVFVLIVVLIVYAIFDDDDKYERTYSGLY
jgi:hypothetical protein